ncbi:MAG: CBS domain-containing protein [Deltaproteobacteria bacterium]|nr:CBS domain-containing protein [Deltaproteobacteria bacterium]MBW2445653.1 CBS domain-containing protein [Deltaproteobacteria bacterium]
MEARQPCQLSDRIGDLMTPSPLVATADRLAADVFEMMNERRIRHVPIVNEKDELEGLVSRWYLLGHAGSGAGSGSTPEGDVTVGELMSERVDTVSADCCAAEAARHMLRTKRSSLVVVDEKRRVIGILTEADFLRLAVRGEAPCSCVGVPPAA